MDDSSSPATTSALNRQAIDAALNCDWDQAIILNQQIIEVEPENIAALNRLAKALTETGKYSQAKKIYNDVLKLDAYNPIAAKNLKRIASFKVDCINISNGQKQKLSAISFLQEPGITKIVNLVKLAEPQKLSVLSAGMTVNMVAKARGITVQDLDTTYLGVLPDDISHQLQRLMDGGNKYQAIIKAVKANGLTILIKEVFRSKRFKNQPSFLEDSHVVSFPSDHLSLSLDSLADDSSSETEENEV